MPGTGGELAPPGWLLGFFGEGFGLTGPLFFALLCVAFLLYLAIVWLAPGLGTIAVRRLVMMAVVLFALAPPLLSLDVFSYISYGSLQEEGLNPYEEAPEAIPDDEAASRVQDFSDAVSVYGPTFTLVSRPIAALGTEAALWIFKALAAMSALALAFVCARLAERRGMNAERAAAFVGLNPLVLVHGVGGAHNDVLMALGMMAAVWLFATSRPAWSGAAMAGAVSIKAVGGLVAPFALAAGPAMRDRARLLGGALVAGALVGVIALIAYGTAAIEALDVLGGSQDRISRYSVPATVSRIFDLDLDHVRAVAIAAFAALVLRWLWRIAAKGDDWIRGAAWAALGLLLATAYMTPWYVVWALPLVAVTKDRRLIAVTMALCAFQLVNAIPL